MQPRRAAVAVVVLVLMGAGLVGAGLVSAGLVGVGLVVALVRAGDQETSRPVVAGDGPALRVLHAWDERRAEAYARGSPGRLRDLYVAGSAAGAADVRLLGDYRSRGLRVTGMRTQVLAVAVLEQRPDRWRMRVTDRLEGAVAVGAGDRQVLPRDTTSTRVLTLMRGGDGRWRVAAVADRS